MILQIKLTAGLEPATLGLEVPRAIQLRHASFFSDAGDRTRVARVKAVYPNRLDYIGLKE